MFKVAKPNKVMETTFYEDNQFRSDITKYESKSTKRPATLDLDSPGTMSKKQRFAILTSPDLNMLKLASPELERFIIANSGNITTTPTPTQFLFPKNVTEEQEQYARGFVDALNQLHQTSIEVSVSNNFLSKSEPSPLNPTVSSAALSKLYSGLLPFYIQPATTSVIKSSVNNKIIPTTNPVSIIRPPSVENTSSNSFQSNSMPLSLDLQVKEEFQTVPSDFSSSPPLSPIYKSIDMADQERIKLERKRHRNRIAATKCRKRKLEKISRLEDKVKDLKDENSELAAVADRLREQVCSLKQQVLEHVKHGCQIMIAHGL